MPDLTPKTDDITTEEKLQKLNRAMPQSLEAEMGILSCILQDPQDTLADSRIELPAEAFYDFRHQIIYATILAMADACQPIDVITLTAALRDQGNIDKVGGTAYLSELFTYIPIDHAAFYRKIVKTKWGLRQLIDTAANIMRDCHEFGSDDPDANISDLISRAQERVFAVKDTSSSGDGGEDHCDVVERVLGQVQTQLQNVAIIPADRIPCGFTGIDRAIWGFQRGSLVIIAGRSSMGKSSLAENFYTNISLGRGHYVEWNGEKWPHRIRKKGMIVNGEMTNDESVNRELVGGAGISLQAMRFGMADRQAFQKLGDRAREIYPSNLRMYDRPGMSIQTLRAIARVRKKRFGLDFIVVDYLQLMKSDSSRAQQSREREISEISAGLKEMAKELDIVVFALSQLNRKADERGNKRPQLSDLRESGSIEQDADIVILLFREGYYDPEAPQDEAEAIIAKGRNVGIGEIPLKFDAARTQFSSNEIHLFSNNPDHRQH